MLSKHKHTVRQKADADEWTTAGWQGIAAEVPEAWNLVAYGGDARSGNFRMDNGEATVDSVVGIEVRWMRSNKSMTDADLDRRLDQYLAALAKTARKQKIVPDLRSDPIIDADSKDRTATRSFSWRTDRKGIGRTWYCSKCKRMVIAQVVTGLKGDRGGTAKRALESLRCHPVDAGWQPWSLYGLHTEVPPSYSLQRKPQLMNIYVQLAFALGESTEEIVVEQWGIANVQLRNSYLDEWFREKSGPLISSLSYDTEEVSAHGHTALRISGRRTGFRYWFAVAWPQMTRLKRPSPFYEACLWECPETNKVHMVQAFSRRRQPDVLSGIVERTKCHS